MPLWSVLLGAAGFVGAYDYIFNADVPEFLTTSVQTLGRFLVVFGIGYLTAAVIDLVFPDESEKAEPAPQELETVGSEI
jgi:hypothetical protein